MVSRATAPIEGSASPRKPSVRIDSRSSPASLEVAWRSTRELEIGARHALAVVGDADQPAAAAVGQHVDAGSAGIERVLDQFLDDAGRALDHLAGGDAVDDRFGQLADGHGLVPDSDSLRREGRLIEAQGSGEAARQALPAILAAVVPATSEARGARDPYACPIEMPAYAPPSRATTQAETQSQPLAAAHGA